MKTRFAVIDTETNWVDQVMSIGVVIADDDTFEPIATKYIIFEAEAAVGGMYSSVMEVRGVDCVTLGKAAAIAAVKEFLAENGAQAIFAYNARFDFNHMPALQGYEWHDIMRFAAYRQYNRAIPVGAVCCMTGRLKSGYGVENVLNMFGERGYREVHNALRDAVDELRIMKYMGYAVGEYPRL